MTDSNNANKQMSLKDEVKKYVTDGCSITFGGFIGRDGVAAAHEIIRQDIKNLTVIDDSKTDVMDLLVGAGAVKRWEGAYLGYGAIGLAPNIRRSVEKGVPLKIELEDWSNAGISMRFLAGSLNVPFMPTRSMLGTDIVKYNQRIKVIEEPYEGTPVALVPAAHPDVAIIHVQRADVMGNAQVWGFTGNDENKARAARHTIITCEEIVSTEEIRRQGNLTLIPFYCVDAVVQVPYGCHPQSCYGYYAYDVLFCGEYHESAKDRDSFLRWLDRYVLGTADHLAYCEMVGWDRLQKLKGLERRFNRIPG
ncbi:glutaconate CoA-transferase subunit A [Desulfotomaculum arcticum]|uniref:Glutaconate CoA-transferase subunit A n=1 Tax=Desulfotruncus arcticus DSM 17038 TaxID=1121424 RepID=A0A1I2WX38_9FIRM|nr:CoA-transferase [Desulfotruncus arcticus]SFH05904.1 glutaconate CoA-transferase subunit A [Desulfotomaculum arcticum] [Desulfotruncus arcticus DSM 17038]